MANQVLKGSLLDFEVRFYVTGRIASVKIRIGWPVALGLLVLLANWSGIAVSDAISLIQKLITGLRP